jgi:membrane-bound serine protease (ClpP class)
MWELIVGLALAGLVLLGVELFVPGMILGILGAASLVAAVAIAFAAHGPAVGSAAAVVLLVLGTVGALVWLRVFPRTAVGKKLTLASSLGGPNEHPDFSALVGQEGVAATLLRPSGTAVFGGRRVDVVADCEFVERGEPVVVKAVEGARVVVRKR